MRSRRLWEPDELPPASAHVAVDGLLVAHARLVGVGARRPASPALMEEVPALVEADLEATQPLLVRLGCLASRLLLEELVLLARQLVDPLDDFLIVHDSPPSSWVRTWPDAPGSIPSCHSRSERSFRRPEPPGPIAGVRPGRVG